MSDVELYLDEAKRAMRVIEEAGDIATAYNIQISRVRELQAHLVVPSSHTVTADEHQAA